MRDKLNGLRNDGQLSQTGYDALWPRRRGTGSATTSSGLPGTQTGSTAWQSRPTTPPTTCCGTTGRR